jgi:hypothetical protein
MGNQYVAALGVLESAGCVRKPGAAEMTDAEKRRLIGIAQQMCAWDGAAAQDSTSGMGGLVADAVSDDGARIDGAKK